VVTLLPAITVMPSASCSAAPRPSGAVF